MALSDGLGAGDQGHGAVRLEADVDILVRRAAGRLDVIGKAETAQQPPRRALRPPRGKAGDVGPGERAIKGFRESAAVDLVAEGVGHRHRRGRDHVLTPQLGAVKAALPGRPVDQPLDDVDRLGKAGAAGHADRRGVGEQAGDLEHHRRDAVHRARQMRILEGLYPAGADQIGPDIGHAGDAQGQKAAICGERQSRLGIVVARLVVGEEHLAAAGDPFDWTPDPPRRPQDQHVLRIDEILGAETAADIGGDKPHRRRRDAQRAGGVVAGDVDALTGNMGGVAALTRIPQTDHAARLDRVGDDAVVVEAELDDMRRRGKGRLDRRRVAGAPVEAQVARHLGRNLRCRRRAGSGNGGHRRQWGIVDHHRFGGIECSGTGQGDDQRHRLAGVADLVRGQ